MLLPLPARPVTIPLPLPEEDDVSEWIADDENNSAWLILRGPGRKIQLGPAELAAAKAGGAIFIGKAPGILAALPVSAA